MRNIPEYLEACTRSVGREHNDCPENTCHRLADNMPNNGPYIVPKTTSQHRSKGSKYEMWRLDQIGHELQVSPKS